MKVIQAKGLTKKYGKVIGISELDLSVEEGDFFGFIGPNGAGKSTTIRILLGLISATSGSAEVLGKRVSLSPKEILSDVGYMPSEAVFYGGMKVKDILKMSARLRGADCESEAKRLCDRLELDVNRRADQLSLGNKKKVGIVCALQHKPRLYILDEPTSGLDPLMQYEFYSLLKERNEQGATVFLSSHVLSEVGKYCKNAAVIKDGHIIASDSVDGLGHTGAKQVVLKGAALLPDIDGIRNVSKENGGISFLFSGDRKKLLEGLSTVDFEDISITDPDLEQVFMHYYEREDR